ncbi:hypothetical protein Acr_00g0049750 [Actinidia rufa]|uniref:Reverse transcriptase zinc-binding domain-containing protein n=1 Tax=Actinidia rufa TaxID=165716 RepID=A0A7J0DM89_9ERIC|nr:hypothetical protein Acr_00g0049750 [Actinidia rufa]
MMLSLSKVTLKEQDSCKGVQLLSGGVYPNSARAPYNCPSAHMSWINACQGAVNWAWLTLEVEAWVTLDETGLSLRFDIGLRLCPFGPFYFRDRFQRAVQEEVGAVQSYDPKLEGRLPICQSTSPSIVMPFPIRLMSLVGSGSQHCRSRLERWNNSSSFSFVLSDSSYNEDEEGEEVNQLVQNMRRIGQPIAATAIPIVASVVPVVVPILVLSSDAEDSDDLAFTPPQPVGLLGKKKTQELVVPNPSTVQDPPPVPQPVLAITAPGEFQGAKEIRIKRGLRQRDPSFSMWSHRNAAAYAKEYDYKWRKCCFSLFADGFVESVNHLLLHCQFSWEIWARCMGWWNIVWVCPADLKILKVWWFSNRYKELEKSCSEALYSMLYYSLSGRPGVNGSSTMWGH